MSQGGWGGGGGGGWGPPGGGYPPGGAPPGGYGPPGGAPPGGGGYGPPGGAPPGGGGYGPPGGAPPGGGGFGGPPGGAPPGGGGFGGPPGGAPPGGYGGPPGGAPPGGYGPPPGGGGYGPPPGGGGFGAPPGGGGFAPPPQGYPPGYTPPAAGGVVAWEDKSRGIFGRWWGTVKEVNFNARAFHAASAQNDDPWPAVTFAIVNGLILGVPIGAFFAIIYTAMGGFFASLAKPGGSAAAPIFAIMTAVGVGVGIALPFLYALGGLISPWIAGGLHHIALAIVGGTSKSYSHTVRVSGYTLAGQLWAAIPMVGGLIAAVFMLISLVTGLDETHKSGMGKAVFAALAPFLLLCLCYCGCAALSGFMQASVPHHR